MEDYSRFMTVRMRLADLRGRGAYAGYANRHNAIFIHIPKTAGTSIAQALFGAVCPLLSYRHYQRANSRKFQRYFKFSFVRNPWDRLVSAFFYIRHSEGTRCGSEQSVADYGDFGSFVRGWLTATNVWSSTHFKPQYYFICDENLQLQIDFLGRMENINADFSALCGRLKVKSELIRVNAGNHRHYTEYYTDELREKVASIYANDIAMFGYQFDS